MCYMIQMYADNLIIVITTTTHQGSLTILFLYYICM